MRQQPILFPILKSTLPLGTAKAMQATRQLIGIDEMGYHSVKSEQERKERFGPCCKALQCSLNYGQESVEEHVKDHQQSTGTTLGIVPQQPYTNSRVHKESAT